MRFKLSLRNFLAGWKFYSHEDKSKVMSIKPCHGVRFTTRHFKLITIMKIDVFEEWNVSLAYCCQWVSGILIHIPQITLGKRKDNIFLTWGIEERPPHVSRCLVLERARPESSLKTLPVLVIIFQSAPIYSVRMWYLQKPGWVVTYTLGFLRLVKMGVHPVWSMVLYHLCVLVFDPVWLSSVYYSVAGIIVVPDGLWSFRMVRAMSEVWDRFPHQTYTMWVLIMHWFILYRRAQWWCYN